jgi:hypothetical protein
MVTYLPWIVLHPTRVNKQSAGGAVPDSQSLQCRPRGPGRSPRRR